jgi:hypothetical protein
VEYIPFSQAAARCLDPGTEQQREILGGPSDRKEVLVFAVPPFRLSADSGLCGFDGRFSAMRVAIGAISSLVKATDLSLTDLSVLL